MNGYRYRTERISNAPKVYNQYCCFLTKGIIGKVYVFIHTHWKNIISAVIGSGSCLSLINTPTTCLVKLGFDIISLQWSQLIFWNVYFLPYSRWVDWGRKGHLTSFSPVTSLNVRINLKNFLAFSFNILATLLSNLGAIGSTILKWFKLNQ